MNCKNCGHTKRKHVIDDGYEFCKYTLTAKDDLGDDVYGVCDCDRFEPLLIGAQ